MTMLVLQAEAQIADARRDLAKRGVSQLDGRLASRVKGLLRRAGVVRTPVVGDNLKSWDVLTTLQFLDEHLSRRAPILDVGCYASEIILSLLDAGYTDLTGIDLNPELHEMPRTDAIKYVLGDFMDSGFPDASFDAVTSISVIEHGLDSPRLLKEMARILRPGGYFIASFDYWPVKIDTGATSYFNMSWLIFSKEDVEALVAEAAKHGLRPVGEMRYDGGEKAVEHGGFRYTFGWLVLQKNG